MRPCSLVTLAVQNALLTVIMHYSRISAPESRAYSAASAVLVNELLKGSISLMIALSHIDSHSGSNSVLEPITTAHRTYKRTPSIVTMSRHIIRFDVPSLIRRLQKLGNAIFSADCWKLSIPAILYVIQNNLQFVAASNLDVATFQVTYQMKILTTAAFSVALLRKKLTTTKWFALLFLAVGVGIVQIQSSRPVPSSSPESPTDAIETNSPHMHEMNPFKGFLAVSFACLTSGLAGVYFEMVLKGSKSDLWVRNVQLSLFSLLPALAPIILDTSAEAGPWFSFNMFRHFGSWAWATVSIQVLGGLITAVVIKYSDNILKGFATSLSIIFSFLAGVALFDFHLTPSFLLGATIVLIATALYNQPDLPLDTLARSEASWGSGFGLDMTLGVTATAGNGRSSAMAPVFPDAPILGHYKEKPNSQFSSLAQATSPSAIAAALGFSSSPSSSPVNPMRGIHDSLEKSPVPPSYRTDETRYITPPRPHHLPPSTSFGSFQQSPTPMSLEAPLLPADSWPHTSSPRSPDVMNLRIDSGLDLTLESRDRLPGSKNPDAGDTSLH
jgi:solute carrier family 35 (UDP-sugar transporter), member A1/2/3